MDFIVASGCAGYCSRCELLAERAHRLNHVLSSLLLGVPAANQAMNFEHERAIGTSMHLLNVDEGPIIANLCSSSNILTAFMKASLTISIPLLDLNDVYNNNNLDRSSSLFTALV